MKPFLVRWFVTTVAVLIAVPLTGIECSGAFPLLGASLLLGIINAFVRPVLLLLSLPFIIFSLGFVILLINAAILSLVGKIIPGFAVPGFWNAFFGALIVSLVSWSMSSFFRGSDGRVYPITHHSQMKSVQGRVIE